MIIHFVDKLLNHLVQKFVINLRNQTLKLRVSLFTVHHLLRLQELIDHDSGVLNNLFDNFRYVFVFARDLFLQVVLKEIIQKFGLLFWGRRAHKKAQDEHVLEIEFKVNVFASNFEIRVKEGEKG